jgi:hypothetical protein
MRRLGAGLILLPLMILCGCAGYRFGAQSLYPSHIQTVYVTMFRSISFRRDLGERLTEAVMKEIELKTPFKVVSSPDADSVLSAEIMGEGKYLVTASQTGEARQSELAMQIKVTWVDRSGRALRNGTQVALDEAVSVVNTNARITPEVGHSVATGQQQAIERAAKQIVAMMEAPW